MGRVLYELWASYCRTRETTCHSPLSSTESAQEIRARARLWGRQVFDYVIALES